LIKQPIVPNVIHYCYIWNNETGCLGQ